MDGSAQALTCFYLASLSRVLTANIRFMDSTAVKSLIKIR